MTTKTRTKVIAGEATFVKPKSLDKGATITGIYKGSYEDDFEKLNHRIEQADGSTKIINGSASLNALLAKIDEGTEVDVVYQGTRKITKGKFAGKSQHVFEVYRLGGNTDAEANAEDVF